jgi:hypothetical protein
MIKLNTENLLEKYATRQHLPSLLGGRSQLLTLLLLPNSHTNNTNQLKGNNFIMIAKSNSEKTLRPGVLSAVKNPLEFYRNHFGRPENLMEYQLRPKLLLFHRQHTFSAVFSSM